MFWDSFEKQAIVGKLFGKKMKNVSTVMRAKSPKHLAPKGTAKLPRGSKPIERRPTIPVTKEEFRKGLTRKGRLAAERGDISGAGAAVLNLKKAK